MDTVVLLVLASQMMRGQAPQIFFPITAPGHYHWFETTEHEAFLKSVASVKWRTTTRWVAVRDHSWSKNMKGRNEREHIMTPLPWLAFSRPRSNCVFKLQSCPWTEVTLSIRAIFGLPLFLFPGKVPSVIPFSRDLSSPLMVWPKYLNFLLFTFAEKLLLTPACSKTHETRMIGPYM